MSSRRGLSLIELLITVGILALGAELFLGLGHSQRATRRAADLEGLTRERDQALERAVEACSNPRCFEDWAREVSPSEQRWVSARLWARVEPGPRGTLRLTVSGEVEGARGPRSLTRLVEVTR